MIDAAYAIEVEKSNWFAHVVDKTTYAGTNRASVDGIFVRISLHRFIAYLSGMDVSNLIDHENQNGLDCRQANLRPATKSTNAQNRGIDRNNTSGVKGVHYETWTGRWRAELWVNKKHLRLGRYATLAEAEHAVLQARREHHGAFANDGKGLLQ